MADWLENNAPFIYTLLIGFLSAFGFVVRTNSRAKSNTHRLDQLEENVAKVEEKVNTFSGQMDILIQQNKTIIEINSKK